MRIRIKDKNRIPEVIAKVEEFDGQKMHVGVLEDGQMGMIASVQEYGIKITVTPKMRGFLAHKGLHLKKSTTHITIPERSFIRAGWDANENDFLDQAEQHIKDAIVGGVSVSAVIDAMGQEARDYIREYARDLKSPANHPFTIDQKGSSNPLVDTGGLIGAITYEVI